MAAPTRPLPGSQPVGLFGYLAQRGLRDEGLPGPSSSFVHPPGRGGLWIEGASLDEVSPHQSLGFGDPTSDNWTYSFGLLDSNEPAFGGRGEVYRDQKSGGQIYDYYAVPEFLLPLIKKELDRQVGQAGVYNLITNNCRHFSNGELEYLIEKYGLRPAQPPARAITPSTRSAEDLTNGSLSDAAVWLLSPGPTER